MYHEPLTDEMLADFKQLPDDQQRKIIESMWANLTEICGSSYLWGQQAKP
jgi:hypothetical protein